MYKFADAFMGLGVMTEASTGICFFKTVVTNEIETRNNDIWVALSFFIGLFFMLGILFIILVIYFCTKKRKRQWSAQKVGRITPAALIATAVMGRVSDYAVSSQQLFDLYDRTKMKTYCHSPLPRGSSLL